MDASMLCVVLLLVGPPCSMGWARCHDSVSFFFAMGESLKTDTHAWIPNEFDVEATDGGFVDGRHASKDKRGGLLEAIKRIFV